MNPPSIRAATLRDRDVIARFNIEMALETEGKRLDPATVARGVTGLFEKAERGFYLLAERDRQVIGQLMVTFEWSDWRDGNFWWIQSVYIVPSERRTGVFRALYDSVLANARRSANVCGLRLYVDADNHSAQRTYQSLGMNEAHYRLYEVDFVFTPP